MLSPPSWNKMDGDHAASAHTPSGLGSGPKVAGSLDGHSANRKFLLTVS